MPTTLLYLPASAPRALAKIPSLDADALILDLEDAVPPEAKAEARGRAADALAAGPRERLVVRVNRLDTPWGADDAAMARACRPAAVLVPKVGSADALRAAQAAAGDVPVWAMIETALGVVNLPMIAAAAAPGAALVLGSNDLLAELGAVAGPARAHLVPVLVQLVVAARAHGLLAIDAVCNRLDDDDALRAEAEQACALGFDGKTLIHPRQIAPCRAAFLPSPAAAARASAIVAAFAAAPDAAVLRVDGEMVERMHLRAAERLLARGPGAPT